MNELQKMFIERTDHENADSLLLISATQAMQRKLEKKRNDGIIGWHTGSCSNSLLKKMLAEHVEKGDMIDVMNLSAMIYTREKLYGKSA